LDSEKINLSPFIHTYAQNNPTRFIDPYGLLTILGGGGFSAVGRVGVEGSAGGYWDLGNNRAGGFSSWGVGAGINASYDIFGGFVLTDLHGITTNTNIVFGFWSLTLLFDPITLDFEGLTVGYGPAIVPYLPYGFSQSFSYTGIKCVIGCRS